MSKLVFSIALISMQMFLPAQKTTTYIAHSHYDFPGPQVYRHGETGTMIYVESDGRHLAAISKDGKLLWTREPHADAHVPRYREDNPQIIYIGKGGGWAKVDSKHYVSIAFTNSQFGAVRISDGDFQFLGQD